MNKYVKQFFHIGLIFSGLGPVTLGIIYLIINASGVTVSLSAMDVFKAILSTYVIAFIHAGSNVFPKIESWSKFKGAFFQGLSLYLVYLGAYLINNWIPFNFIVIAVFTGIFVVTFAVIWVVVYFVTKSSVRKMNDKLKELNR